MGTRKGKGWKITASPDTIARLWAMAEAQGNSFSANGLASIVVYEFSRVKPADLWVVLGSIRQYAEQSEQDGKGKLPAGAGPLALSR